MSFCGTNELNDRFQMFGFYMHCEGLAHRLFGLKLKHRADEGGQMRLFQLTAEDREDFAKFSANLRWLITDHAATDELWAGYTKFDYTTYEFRELFDPFQRDKSDAVVSLLERVGNGEALDAEELHAAMEFLRMLGGRAYTNTHRGGCF